MNSHTKIGVQHLQRQAFVYIPQSSLRQVEQHLESQDLHLTVNWLCAHRTWAGGRSRCCSSTATWASLPSPPPIETVVNGSKVYQNHRSKSVPLYVKRSLIRGSRLGDLPG